MKRPRSPGSRGENDDAEKRSKETYETSVATSDRIRAAEALIKSGKQLLKGGDVKEAVSYFDKAAALARLGEAHLWSAKVEEISHHR